jgi:hypothetical protein
VLACLSNFWLCMHTVLLWQALCLDFTSRPALTGPMTFLRLEDHFEC